MHKLLFFFLLSTCLGKSQKISKKDVDYIEKDPETGWFRAKSKTGKYGFIDKDSIIKIPFIYDFINPFDENKLAYVKDKGKELYIDVKGEIIIPENYTELGLFSEGLVSAKKNGKFGFIDASGETAISFLYDSAGFFCQGLALVSKNKKYGFIDKEGKEIIPVIYSSAWHSQTDSIVIISNDEKWAFVNNNGKFLSDFVYDKVFTGYKNMIPSVVNGDKTTYFKNGAVLVLRNKKYEFLNEKIESAFPENKFDSASVFDTYKNAIVKRSGKYGIINSDGIAKAPIEYDFIKYFDTNHNSSEYYNARKGKVFHIYNKDLKKIGESHQPIYNDFSVSTPVIIFRNLQEKYGMVNSNGNIVIPFEYEELYKQESGFIVGKRNGKAGVFDKNGKLRISFEYKDLYEFDDKNGIYLADGNKIVDTDNKVLLSGYQNIAPVYYNNERFIVSRNKKYGIVDIKNKVLLPLEYDEISNWVEYGPRDRHFIVKNGKHGLIEHGTFKVIIPPVYDLFIQRRGMIFAHKNGKSGILNINNKEICPFIFDEIKPDLFFGYGYNEKNYNIYSRKGNKFYEITSTGKIIKEISRKVYKENTEHQNI